MVFADEFLDSTDLCSRKSAAALQPDWIKPELCNFVVPLNVTMLGLIAIPCEKKKRYGPTLSTVGIYFSFTPTFSRLRGATRY